MAADALGIAGVALIPAMFIFTSVGGLIAARRPGGFIDIPQPPLEFLATPLSGAVVFVLLGALALAARRDPPAHKRLMLLTSISMLEAPIVRWPFAFVSDQATTGFWLSTLFLAPLAIWDLVSIGKLNKATLWGGLLIVAVGPLREMVSRTHAWLVFAKWAVGLLG